MTLKFVFPSPRSIEKLRKDVPCEEPHDGVSGDLYLDSEMGADARSEAVIDIGLIGQARY